VRRTARLAIFAASFLAAALLVHPAGAQGQVEEQFHPGVTDRSEAVLLYGRALDLALEFDYDSTLALLRAARDADPSYLPVHLYLIGYSIPRVPDALSHLRAEYAAMPDTPLIECVRTWISIGPGTRANVAERLFELERLHPAESCPVVLLGDVLRYLRPRHAWDPSRLEYLARAVVLEPDWIDGFVQYAGALTSAGRLREAERTYAAALRHHPRPQQAISLHMRRAGVLIALGETAAAEAVHRVVREAVERDGRPGARLKYLYESRALTTGVSKILGSMDAALRQQAALARRYGSPADEWQARYTMGLRWTNRGDPRDAIEQLDRAVMIAEETGISHRLSKALYKRAAAFVRTGRRQAAEHDLLRAVELIPIVQDPYDEAETWHGLLHLYGDDGRIDEALNTARRFLAAAEQMPHSPLRMSAWLDLGELLWKAGQHAAAEEAFHGMVRVVDDFDEYHAYAGQYFERTGDLDAAREYFGRGARASWPNADQVRALNWAGLARVYEALGAADSAEAAARAHDAAITEHWDIPLLPGVLAQQGRTDEAVEIASSWARHRLEAGAVEGAAASYVLWAELLLEAGRAEEALAIGTRADSLASSMDRVAMSAEANRVRGLALEALRQPRAALQALEASARSALRDGDSGGVIDSHVALGELLAHLDRTSEALAVFEVAAGRVEQMTEQLGVDYDRVRFRQQRMAPFDAALRALAQSDSAADPAELLAWSARRKAAALRLARGDSSGTSAFPHSALRLGPREVLLDYSVLPDMVILVTGRVVTPSGGDEPEEPELSALRLTIAPDSLRALVDRLRRPFTSVSGGRIDLARAQYRTDVARALYDALLSPVEHRIGDAQRLLVSPDGPLHRVSFAGLVPTSGGFLAGEDYLIDRFEFSYLAAAGLASGAPSGRGSSVDPAGPIAVLFGEAPGARREVETLARLWPGEVLVTGSGVTSESAVFDRLTAPSVLHVAAHAVADDRDPFASHIRLARDSMADGLLHGTEIERLDLPGTLVVLSACATVEGPLFEGEGLLGLRRSFLATGASGVVATLWPVGPSAADLIGHFYERLVAGDAPAAALRIAQLRMRSDPDTAHPFHWAGFVLFGGD